MEVSLSFGLFAVLLGGVLQGSVLLPMKFTRRWQWENTWIGFSTVAFLFLPWLLTPLLVPHFPSMLWDVPPRVLATTLLFGVGWGLGAVTMGLGFRYMGMAIATAIHLGVASPIATLVPFLALTSEREFARHGFSVMLGVVITLAGTAVVSWAAWERDSKKQSSEGQTSQEGTRKSLAVGLALCISSGVLAACGNLGFAFANKISQKALELGAGPAGSAGAIWSVILVPVFLCNFLYCLYLLRKNRTVALFRAPGTGHYWGLAILMGVVWMGGIGAYGAGAVALGAVGTSMGFILCLSCIIMTSNILGVLAREWEGASRRTMAIMAAGIAILLLGIVVVGTSRTSG